MAPATLLCLLVAREHAYSSARSEPAPSSMLCGPLSAQFVLKQLGKREELSEILEEFAQDELKSGVRLSSISRCLQTRGIATQALELSSWMTIRWSHPVIVHVRRAESSDFNHYIVWIRSAAGRQCEIWDPAIGAMRVPETWLSTHMSGVVLLTSPGLIENPQGATGIAWDVVYMRLLEAALAPLMAVLLVVTLPILRPQTSRFIRSFRRLKGDRT